MTPSVKHGAGSPYAELASTLIFDLPTSRIMRNDFLLFISHPVYILLQQSKQAKTATNWLCVACLHFASFLWPRIEILLRELTHEIWSILPPLLIINDQ